MGTPRSSPSCFSRTALTSAIHRLVTPPISGVHSSPALHAPARGHTRAFCWPPIAGGSTAEHGAPLRSLYFPQCSSQPRKTLHMSIRSSVGLAEVLLLAGLQPPLKHAPLQQPVMQLLIKSLAYSDVPLLAHSGHGGAWPHIQTVRHHKYKVLQIFTKEVNKEGQ